MVICSNLQILTEKYNLSASEDKILLKCFLNHLKNYRHAELVSAPHMQVTVIGL